MNTRIQNLKVWLKYVLLWLKYNSFSGGLFFIGAPHSNSRDDVAHLRICVPVLGENRFVSFVMLASRNAWAYWNAAGAC